MFGLRRKTFSCGLQLQDHQIKLAAVAGNERMQIRQIRSASLPEGAIRDGRIHDADVVVSAIRKMAAELSLAGKSVVLTIPTSSVVLRRSVFPARKEEDLRGLIDVELNGNESLLPFRNPVFDFVRIGESEKGTEVVIFASPAEVVSQYVQAARSAGLNPTAVDVAPLALLRVLKRCLKATGGTLPGSFMILNAESEMVEISIFSDGCPAFFRSIPVQVRAMVDEDADYLETYGRFFSVELARVMNFYKYSVSEQPPAVEAIYLIGDAHFAGGILPILESEFPGVVRLLDIDAFLRSRNPDLPNYAIPIGLAMKGA
jgi:type IV pilus assembly protein PilM